jgi:hypothetical protein
MKLTHPDDGISTLARGLDERLTVPELQRLAELFEGPAPRRKAELVEHIVQHLAGDGLLRVWGRLDQLQRAAVAEVVHSASPTFDAARFRAKYARDPDWGELDPYRRGARPTPLRLLFCGAVLPADLKERLRAFVPPPAAATLTSVAELPDSYPQRVRTWVPTRRQYVEEVVPVPLTVRKTEGSAPRELLAVLRLVDAGRVAVSETTRRPSAASVAAVSAVLDGGEYYPAELPDARGRNQSPGPIRAFAWPLLLQAGGLAERAGSRLRLSASGRRALSRPPAETLRALWKRWQANTILDELARIECVKGQTGKGARGLTAPATRRRGIATALAAADVGRWVQVDDLLRFQRALGEHVPVTRDPWRLYLVSPQYGTLGYDVSVAVLERRYLYAVLFEYAATLGLIDVAYVPPAGARDDFHGLWGADELAWFSRHDGLVWVRVNALGAWCLDPARSYEAAPDPAPAALRLGPTLEIEVDEAALAPADRLALEACARRAWEGVWHLDAPKLLAAVEEGRMDPTLAPVREFLETRSGGPLPPPLDELLADVARRTTLLQDRGLARLVECADAALAERLATDPRTRKHCLRAGDRHLVVRAAAETAFRSALREAGYVLPGAGSEPARPRRAGRRPPGGPAEG